MQYSKEMNQSGKSVVLAASAGLLGLLVLYQTYNHWDTIVEIAENVRYDNEKVAALHQLRKIRKALANYTKELNAAESKVDHSRNYTGVIDPVTKNSIRGLSMDLDFVLTSLDKIHGDAAIKAERKRLVDEFEKLSGRVDALVAKID